MNLNAKVFNFVNRLKNILLWCLKYFLINRIETILIDTNQNSNVVLSQKRLRAGGRVAQEKTGGCPYKALNIRRGNAMRYLVLDYIKQKPLRGKHILLPVLSEEKRKAMENIAAQAFFEKIDAYQPEEHFFPLHIKPSGELYYIPEKKIDQMLYVVNKLKKSSLESIVTDVTWESSSTSEEEDRYILDFKTEKVLTNANRCDQLISEIEKYYQPKDETGDFFYAPEARGSRPRTRGKQAQLAMIRRSTSLPILNQDYNKQLKYRSMRSPILSKAVSDDDLNIYYADIQQHNLAYTPSTEYEMDENITDKHEMLIKELSKPSLEDLNQQSTVKQVRFAPNIVDNEKHKKLGNFCVDDIDQHNLVRAKFGDIAMPSTSGEYQRMKKVKPKKESTDDINQHNLTAAIYDEINEIKASLNSISRKFVKTKMKREDLNISIDDINQHNLTTVASVEVHQEKIDEKSKKELVKDRHENIDLVFPSTSGEYKKHDIQEIEYPPLMESIREDFTDSDESVEDDAAVEVYNSKLTKKRSDLHFGEKYLMEKMLKNERIMNKSEQLIKMKRRSRNIESEISTEQINDEQLLEQMKNKPKRYNIYTLQKLQTEFDTSLVGDTLETSKTISALQEVESRSDLNELDVTNDLVTNIEMKSYASTSKNKNTQYGSDSITDSETNEFDDNVKQRHTKKLRRRAVKFSKDKVVEPNRKSSFNISSIPIIGRFFQKKT